MKVTLMMVMTADGFIAKNAEQTSTDWTSSADKQIFIERTKEAGVIIMGLTTYKTINKPLPGRLNVILTREPEKETSIPNQLEYTNTQPAELLKQLEDRGYKEVILGGGSTINSLFLKAGLVDEMQITIEPLLFGGGLTLFNNLDLNQKLKLIEIKDLGQNVVNLRYQVIK
ncbi:MAG: FolA: dihydrofolate reductase [Parcubacteria group bacterium GW2011_GWC2_38_7]|nr:MAG: FolA: dihydrofolate reductase [Parcubacteria group bacterium GW2011_GWC2_38_7]